MDLRALSEIKFLKVNRPLLLLELLELIDGAKPGVFIESLDKDLLKNLSSLCKQLGLFVSFKNNGYITKDWFLFKEWESSIEPILTLADKFIGYPSCCVKAFSKIVSLPLSRELYWYYNLMTHNNDELINYTRMVSYVNHFPCSFNCKETSMQRTKLFDIIRKYSYLLPKNIERQLYAKRLGSIKRFIKSILYAFDNKLFVKEFGNALSVRKRFDELGLIKLLGLGNDFVEVINELFVGNPKDKLNQLIINL
ncbi:MAG: DUF483 domain-containing protein [Candidatus Nanoarchaeia archaeon]|jgi:hypothetical protein